MTIKQKQVAKDLLENVGKPVGKAMLDAGYSPATAKNPDHLTESKGWKELMDEALPDSDLAEVHRNGLHAKKQIGALIFVKADGTVLNKSDEGMIEVEDHAVQHKFLETAYKLKKRLGPEVLQQFNVDKGNSITFVNFKNESTG